MRRISVFGALVLGSIVTACGGGDENLQPATPANPPAPAVAETPAPPTPAPAVVEKPKPSPVEMATAGLMEWQKTSNSGDAKKIASMYTEDAVVKTAGMPDMKGRTAVEEDEKMMQSAFSGSKIAPWRYFSTAKGDMAVCEWVWNGTHSGEFAGIKATNKPVGFNGVSVLWFTPEGLVKEEHRYFDMATIMSQVGATKEPARPVASLPEKPEVYVAKGDPSEEKNVELLETAYNAMEKKSEKDFLGMLSDNVEYDDYALPAQQKGKGDAKKFFGMFTTAFPDMTQKALNTIAVGDFAIAEFNFKGTHQGALGPIKPTKKMVNANGVDIYQFKDGKMQRGWSYSNSLDMMTQLGLIKPAGAKAATKAATPAKTDAPAKTDKAPAKTDKAPAKTDKAPAKK